MQPVSVAQMAKGKRFAARASAEYEKKEFLAIARSFVPPNLAWCTSTYGTASVVLLLRRRGQLAPCVSVVKVVALALTYLLTQSTNNAVHQLPTHVLVELWPEFCMAGASLSQGRTAQGALLSEYAGRTSRLGVQ